MRNIIIVFCSAFILPFYLFAQSSSGILSDAAFNTSAKSAIIMDYDSSKVLYSKDSDLIIGPASMTKMMTLYMLFEMLKNDRLKLDDKLLVSIKAWKMGGSKMFVREGDRVSVEDLIYGITVQSGNDATIVVAEAIGGDEETFAAMMTKKAKELGMMNTNFKNASGWPAEDHFSTAHDMAILAQRTIKDFPEYYHMYSEKEFVYSNVRQYNRNPLLISEVPGVDGLKTGHTERSGYSLTASGVRNNQRLIMVVSGFETNRERRAGSERLFEWGFRTFGSYPLYTAGQKIDDVKVWLGESATLPVTVLEDVRYVATRSDRDKAKFYVSLKSPVPAPIKRGDIVGNLVVHVDNKEVFKVPVRAMKDVAQLNAFQRIGSAIQFLIFGDSS